MDGDIKNFVWVVEHVLDSVPVVHVPVQDKDFVHAVHGARIFRSNSHVVKDTETMRLILEYYFETQITTELISRFRRIIF